MVSGVENVMNLKDFWAPNKEIQYFSRTLTEFKDFSRLYELCDRTHPQHLNTTLELRLLECSFQQVICH